MSNPLFKLRRIFLLDGGSLIKCASSPNCVLTGVYETAPTPLFKLRRIFFNRRREGSLIKCASSPPYCAEFCLWRSPDLVMVGGGVVVLLLLVGATFVFSDLCTIQKNLLKSAILQFFAILRVFCLFYLQNDLKIKI